MTGPIKQGWRRTCTGKLLPPTAGTKQELEGNAQRIAQHAERMRKAKPQTEDELRALVEARLADQPVTTLPVAGGPREPLRWTLTKRGGKGQI